MKQTAKIVFVATILMTWFGHAEEAKPKPFPSAEELAKEKGYKKPTEILTWNQPKTETSKDEVVLNNKYFSVTYPKCFSAIAEGGDADEGPSISTGVAFYRQKSCPLFETEKHSFDGVDIIADLVGKKISKTAYEIDGNTGGAWIFKQKMMINDSKAMMQIGIIDSCDVGACPLPMLREEIWTVCNGVKFSFGVAVNPGEDTMAALKKDHYEIPEDLKKIILSFKCTKYDGYLKK
jgi:hypothetical protein